MDQDTIKATRRRAARAGSAPALEPLEGRQLMAAGAAGGGVKIAEVEANGLMSLVVTGTNRADTITIDDNGSGQPGALTVRLGDGSTYTSKAAIGVIQVLGKGGNDRITYNLNGNLAASQIVLVDGAAGNDRITANVNGNVDNAAGLDLEFYGGAGNDTMVTNQRGAVAQGSLISYLQGDAGNDALNYNGSGAVAPGASLIPEFAGGAGNDRINSNYSGVIAGNFIYNLSVDGGPGNDNIVSNIFAAAGSRGTVGASSSSPAAVQGGAGNDKIRFAVRLDPTVSNVAVNAVALGGTGRDVVTRTVNVEGDPSNEKESIIS